MPTPRCRQPDDPELQWVENLVDDLLSVLWQIVTSIAGILWAVLRTCFKT